MLQKIFDMDNGLMQGLARITDLVVLNLLFLLCSLPIVTFGASLSALYSMTLKMVRNEEPYLVRGFFAAFRRNLKQGSIFGSAALVILSAVSVNLRLLKHIKAGGPLLIKVLCIALVIFVVLLSLYLFPMIGRFEMPSAELFRNAFVLCGAYLPKTLLLLACYVPFVIFLIYSDLTMYVTLTVLLLIGFSLLAFVQSYVLRGIFDLYEPSEDSAEE